MGSGRGTTDGGDASAATSLHHVVGVLHAADLATCGHAELDALAGALQQVRGFVSAFEVRLSRRRDELMRERATPPTGHTSDGATTIAGAPLDLSGVAPTRDRRAGRASEHDRVRAEVCGLLPPFERALARGEIDAGHVDAVAAAWRDLDDDERGELAPHAEALLVFARVEAPERFRRRVRDLARQVARDHGERVAERRRAAASVRRWIDVRTGMGHLHAELDPETTARVWTALDERLADVASRPDTAGTARNRLEVDALVELVTASSALDPRAPELCVLVDLATLETGQFTAGSVCETTDGMPLTPAAARRLACEASILPMVLGGDGVPLDVGRRRRLATREQRRALAAMYATCALPGCGVRVERCRVHHVEPWLPVGPTDLSNLVPVCERHHHQVHEGCWQLSLTPERVITLRRPDGTVEFVGDTRDRHRADPMPDDLGPPGGPAAAAATPSDPGAHLVAWPAGTPADPSMCRPEQVVAAARARAAALARARCRRASGSGSATVPTTMLVCDTPESHSIP